MNRYLDAGASEPLRFASNTVLSRRRGPENVEIETHLPETLAKQWWGDRKTSRDVGIRDIARGVLLLTEGRSYQGPSDGALHRVYGTGSAGVYLPNTLAPKGLDDVRKQKAAFLFGAAMGPFAIMSLPVPFAQRVDAATAELSRQQKMAPNVAGLVLSLMQVDPVEYEEAGIEDLANPFTPSLVLRMFPELEERAL